MMTVFAHYTISTTITTNKKIPTSKTKKLERKRNEFNIYPAPRELRTIEVWFKEESEGKIQKPLTIPVIYLKAQT